MTNLMNSKMVSKEHLQTLMQKIDQAWVSQQAKIQDMQSEIDLLKKTNNQLQDIIKLASKQIEEYLAELEQIKKDYVNSNHHH